MKHSRIAVCFAALAALIAPAIIAGPASAAPSASSIEAGASGTAASKKMAAGIIGKTADITPMHWSCLRAAPPDIDTTGGHHTIVAAAVYVGSSTRCRRDFVIETSEALDYHCYALDINGIDTWTYVVSVPNPTKRGWVRDSLLNDFGSFKWCPGQT